MGLNASFITLKLVKVWVLIIKIDMALTFIG